MKRLELVTLLLQAPVPLAFLVAVSKPLEETLNLVRFLQIGKLACSC